MNLRHTIGLHAYNSRVRPLEQAETWESLYAIERQSGLNVLHWDCCCCELEYENALWSLWDKGDDLVLIEQDIVPTMAHVRGMLDCPHPLCIVAYPLWKGGPYAHRTFKGLNGRIEDGPYEWISNMDDWADLGSFGFIKIDLAIQVGFPAPQGPWDSLDTFFSFDMFRSGTRFHVHWPEVVHNRHHPMEAHSL